MPKLKYYREKDTFLLRVDSPHEVEGLGLARDEGFPGYVYVTGTKDETGFSIPSFNPYGVLSFFQYAEDAETQAKLFDYWVAYHNSFSKISFFEPPAPPGRAYLPYQKAGIEYALDRKNCLIADEPGLGKTIQAIGLANSIKAKSMLVVCPASVRMQWHRQILAWTTVGRACPAPIFDKKELAAMRADPHRANYLILSYDAVRDPVVRETLIDFGPWDLMVLDEAHYLKSRDAARTQAIFGSVDGDVRGLADHCERILALTGTPLPNRPRECYTLAINLCPDAIDGMGEKQFMNTYNPSIRLKNFKTVNPVQHLAELHMRLRCNFMVRRQKMEVLDDLPAKYYTLQYLDPTADVAKVIEAERLLDIDVRDMSYLSIKTRGELATLRKEMGLAKVKQVCAYVDDMLDQGVGHVVVFAYHVDVVDAIAKHFNAASICGATSPRLRAEAVARFQNDPDCHVFVGQLQAAGTGIDGLQNVCDEVVFAEASWTPGENEQCVDRLHRIGQKGCVHAQFLVAPDSLDARILSTAIEKYKVIDKTLDERVSFA